MAMSTPLQETMQRRSEARRVDGYKASLSAFECGAIVATDQFPLALESVIERAGKVDRPSQSMLLHEAGTARALAWAREMFLASGIGTEKFYLSTPFRHFRWLECKPVGDGWIENLEVVCDLDFCVISHDKTLFLSVDHEEHWWDAYWSRIE